MSSWSGLIVRTLNWINKARQESGLAENYGNGNVMTPALLLSHRLPMAKIYDAPQALFLRPSYESQVKKLIVLEATEHGVIAVAQPVITS